MRIHLQKDLDRLKKKLLRIGGMVEEATRDAMVALRDRRLDLALQVKNGDAAIDAIEVEFEEDCLKVLALHAPVAADLRVVVAFLKVNNDLERIGDLAKNIAERAEFLATREPITVPPQVEELATRVRDMLRGALDSVVNLDQALAHRVVTEDDHVDDIHKGFYGHITDALREQPANAELLLQLLSVSRYLERMADQATNIAEDVIFVVEGEVVRHQK